MNIQEALDEYLERIADAMVNNLYENKSVATGKLAKSIKNDNRVVETEEGYEAVLTMLWYGETVDEGIGRGPNPGGKIPPIAPIEDWIKRKRIPVPAAFKSPKQFAFAIAGKIRKEGDRNSKRKYPFIQNSITQVKTQFGDALIEKAAGEQITDQLTLAFIESTK
jgi:hypothetical protein